MLGLFMIIQSAYGLNVEINAGTGRSSVSAASNALLGTEDILNQITSVRFDDGVSLTQNTNSRLKTGNGQLNENHSATNANGDYVNVSAHLDDSTSWAYSYDLASRPSYVTGRENVRVVGGTGLEFKGVARSSSGSYAEVSAVGGEDCPVSMTYSNSVKASRDSASASQQISGASSAGISGGCTDPLVIQGLAYPDGFVGAPISHVTAGVLGGSRVYAATSASSSSGGYKASQSISAARFDKIWNEGYSSQAVAGSISAAVGAGASNGANFFSSVDTSFKSGKAEATQIARGSGSSVYKFSEATGGLYSNASTNTTVLNGSLATYDKATGKWNSSEVSEILSASGDITRSISAYGAFTPGWNREEITISVDNGRLLGSAKASSTSTSFAINGRWLGIEPPGIYGMKSVVLRNDTAGIGAAYLWNNTAILID